MSDAKQGGRDIVPGFARMVREWREARGWSQRELAERAGVAVATVSMIEAEQRSPSLRVAAALCEALGILSMTHDPARSIGPGLERSE